MKLLNFKLDDIERWGALTDDGIVDLMQATNKKENLPLRSSWLICNMRQRQSYYLL